jgi:hypothetical protein
MPRRFASCCDWPLFLVAVAGVCASFLCGGESAAAPAVSDGAEQPASAAAPDVAVVGERSFDELRRMDSKVVESVLRREVGADVPLPDGAAALVLDPDDAAWFDWDFEPAQRWRLPSYRRSSGARGLERRSGTAAGSGGARAASGR